MQTILGGFPDIRMIVYPDYFPETATALIQELVYKTPNAYEQHTHLNFFDGMIGVEGYREFSIMTETFYKAPLLGSYSWDAVLQEHYNKLYGMFSRRLLNWKYAHARINSPPFIWIDEPPKDSPVWSGYTSARSPEWVKTQLEAFKKWGDGGKIVVFPFQKINSFDYSIYAEALRSASQSDILDIEPPTLDISPFPGVTTEQSITLSGFAHDNLAVKSIEWENHYGGSGMAETNWEALSGDRISGWTNWRINWAIKDIPLVYGTNTITLKVTNNKGLTYSQKIAIKRDPE